MTTILFVDKQGNVTQSPIPQQVQLKTAHTRPAHQQRVFAMTADALGICGEYCGSSDMVAAFDWLLHWDAVAGWLPAEQFVVPNGK